MPIWFELIALLLTVYGAGIAAGWLLWSRRLTQRDIEDGKEHE